MQRRCKGVSHRHPVRAPGLRGPGIWGADEGVWLTSLGVPATPGGTARHPPHPTHPPPQNIICTAIHLVYCQTPPWAPRTDTSRGHTALELREGSKKQPSQKAQCKAALCKPCYKHMLKKTMLRFLRKKQLRRDACGYPHTKPAGSMCSSSAALQLGSSRTIAQQGSPAERPAPLSYIQLLQHSIYMTDTWVHLHSSLITLSHSPQPKEVAATAPQLRTSREEPRSQHAGDFAPLGVQAELSTAASPPEPSTGLFSKVTHGHSCLIHSLAQLQNIH